MNSVTSAQLQPSTARTNTCACTRAPLEQATAFVVARLLRLRNRARRLCARVFWARRDKWCVFHHSNSSLDYRYILRAKTHWSGTVILPLSSVTTVPFSGNDLSLVTSLRKRHARDLLSAHARYILAFSPHFFFLSQIIARVSTRDSWERWNSKLKSRKSRGANIT